MPDVNRATGEERNIDPSVESQQAGFESLPRDAVWRDGGRVASEVERGHRGGGGMESESPCCDCLCLSF